MPLAGGISTRARLIGRVVLVLTAVLTSGCVYFNGIYNANAAARNADARLRRGLDGEATNFFQQSAATAETVLVRHPKSKWRSRALYLSGRGSALAGQCDAGVPRLEEFLSLPGSKPEDRDRARVALGACEIRLQRLATARARLDSLTDAPDKQTARQARLWAARAALTAGDRDAVSRYLGADEDNALPWELLLSSLSAREYTRVESLLVQRAVRADYRDDVPRALREMWSAGHWDGVESVVRGYDAVRIRDASRATLHFAVGDLNLRAGRDSLARQHLFTARSLAARDTVLERESAARLVYLNLVRAPSLREVDTLLARTDSTVLRSPYARRMSDQLLLVRLFAQQDEPTGAAWYLGAEVARDSLRAPLLARTLFLRVAREQPASPLAASAWYAAGVLEPDSAPAWNARVRAEYSTSAVAAWLAGEDPAQRPDYSTVPAFLDARWTATIRVWADSVRKLRAPPRTNTSSPNFE